MPADGQRRVVLVRGPADGPWELVSPGVGWWIAAPAEGAWLGPGASLGRLRTLDRRVRLVLPDRVAGSAAGAPHARLVPVAYGDLLLRLTPIGPASRSAAVRAPAPPSGADPSALSPGCAAVRAPTDGIFYHRPEPSAAPFVAVGSRIRAGQPLGLIEVMKTFNQIVYGGTGLPDPAEVVELCCGDGQEVAAGQPLIVVRAQAI